MKKFLTILCLLACLVACESTELGSAFQKGQEVTITASIGQQRPQALPGMQRVSGKDTDPANPNGGAIALTWNEGDKILVKVGDDVSEFTLLTGAGTGNGTFIGNMPDNGSSFSVQYPTFTPNLAMQQYVENGFAKDLMLMTTKEEGTIDDGFALSADYALLGLHFTGDTIVSKIVLTNLETNATYTLDCSQQVVSIAGGKLFYLIVPPGIWNNGMKVDVYDTNHTIILSKAKSEKIVFNASNAMLMSDLEINKAITFEVNGTNWFDMIFVKGNSSLSDFYIGQTEVTQRLWKAVMGTNPCKIQGNDLPVMYVSWQDCQAFIQKLNQLTGYHFRLPTEAEWEYAARGGEKSKGYEYAGSDMIGDVAWYQGNSSNTIHTIAKKLPNELGIYDMSGNVWEWCEDYYDTDETMHVVKSGSFYDSESACRIDARTARLADYKSYIGLRLLLEM